MRKVVRFTRNPPRACAECQRRYVPNAAWPLVTLCSPECQRTRGQRLRYVVSQGYC